jgi:urease alpha subunit
MDKDNQSDIDTDTMTDLILTGEILFHDGTSKASIGVKEGKIEYVSISD